MTRNKKLFLLSGVFYLLHALSLSAQSTGEVDKKERKIKDDLILLETQSWEAWKRRDGKFFETFLSDDHLEVGNFGVVDKNAVVANVNNKSCVVKSYSIGQFKLTFIDPKTVILAYFASQETTCSSKKIHSPVWVSSIYQNRNKKWLNVFYQQSWTKE